MLSFSNCFGQKTKFPYFSDPFQADGLIAQMGERLNGIQEVRGSIPLKSTLVVEFSKKNLNRLAHVHRVFENWNRSSAG